MLDEASSSLMMEGTGHKDGLDAIAERGWVFLELLFLPFKWTWWIEQPEGLGSSKNIKDCYFLGFVSLICPPSVVLAGLHLSRHSSFHLWHWPCYQASVQSLVYETHLCGFYQVRVWAGSPKSSLYLHCFRLLLFFCHLVSLPMWCSELHVLQHSLY